jgi:hypothetical protein
MNEIKISAIVVGRNEAGKLENCFKSLVTCNEILYGDLDSSDNSIEIAKLFNCRIFSYKTFGPSCEYTQAELIKNVSNDWVIMVDPDEVVDPTLMSQIKETLLNLASDETIGDIYVPWQFYFGNKKLRGTVWGYNKNKGIVVNRNRYEILPITHYGRRLKDGFKSYFLKPDGNNVLHHYWMDNVSTFISKHKKYLKDEGRDRYNMGQRISAGGIIYNFFYQFLYCFFVAKGYKDRFVGLFLSIFWMWYSASSNIYLYRTTISNKKNVKN